MIRILIANSQATSREQLRAQLASDPEIEITGLARDGQEALQLAHQLQPDIALLSDNLTVMDGFQTMEFITAAHLPTQCMMLSETYTPEQFRRAMRAGAREFLAFPVESISLLQSLHDIYDGQQRRRSTEFAAAADPSRLTRVFAITGAKGGIGKTTVATNLAVALAMETGEPTVIIDLYTQYGDVPMMLNLTPKRVLTDLATMNSDTIDAPVVEECMEKHESGLRLLATATSPVALDALTVPTLEGVLRVLKQSYRYVVMDIPPILHSTSLYAISHATSVLVIANLFDITTINDTRRMLETLEGRYVARDRIMLVLNRMARQNRMQLADIEQAIGFPMSFRIPNDGEVVPNSVNQGIPFVFSHPDRATSQSFRHLARALAEGRKPSEEMTEERAAPARGLLSRWLGAPNAVKKAG